MAELMEEVARWTYDKKTDKLRFLHNSHESPFNEIVEAKIRVAKIKAGWNPFANDVHTPVSSLVGEECVT